MKKNLLVVVAAATSMAITASGAAPALAAYIQTPKKAVSVASQSQEQSPTVGGQIKEKVLERAKVFGANLIDKRIRVLERQLEKVRNMQRITEADRSYLVDKIEGNLTELANLKSRIEQATDLETLKADIKSIVTNFRVFTVVLPKMIALQAADRASWGAQRFDVLAVKIQERIDKAKAAGKDVTKVQELADQFKAKIAAAKSNIDKAVEAFKSMLPVDQEGAKSSFTSGKDYLTTARQEFKEAIDILKRIVQAFKDIRAGEDSPTASN